MKSLTLTGMDGTNAMGFLAAIGTLLAVRDQRRSGKEPRLGFLNDGAWRPVLYGVDSVDALVPWLVADLKQVKNEPALRLQYTDEKGKLHKELKPPPEIFRGYLQALMDGLPKTARSLDFAAAFATEVGRDNNGATKPTALHFSAGQQEFLDTAHKLIEFMLAGDTASYLLEAVAGPWTHSDRVSLFDWDSTADRSYALRANDPSTAKKTGTAGAEWLAFRGLPLLRTVPHGHSTLTTGCAGSWKEGHFTWPLWTVPLKWETIRSLVAHRYLEQMSQPERKARGIGHLCRCGLIRAATGGRGGITPAKPV